MPLLHKLTDGEDAHNLAIKLAKYGLVPKGKALKNAEILVWFLYLGEKWFFVKIFI